MRHLVGQVLRFRDGERLFEAVWHLMQLIGGLATAQSSRMPDAHSHEPGEFGLFSHHFGTVLSMPAQRIVEYTLGNIVPEAVELQISAMPESFRTHQKLEEGQVDQISELFNLCASVVFVNFYERYKPFIRQTWGRSAKDWPPVIGFARVIRNCLAHSGRIAIDEGTAGGKWRGFSYARADDGRRVIGTELSAVDLIYLLFDLASQLDRAGAPNLATPAIAA